MKTTCQICEREIKAAKGIIAHHGYRRPGSGWQTKSCPGARHRPYEVANDAIPPVITLIENFIKATTGAIHRIETTPPDKLTLEPRFFNEAKFVELDRPADFEMDGPAYKARMYTYRTYENKHSNLRTTWKMEVRHANGDRDRLTKRFNDWKPEVT